VQDDEDGGAKIVGQGRQQGRQRLDPARGRADDDGVDAREQAAGSAHASSRFW
jgi:hypothetical protein